jgi:hypothetical protein
MRHEGAFIERPQKIVQRLRFGHVVVEDQHAMVLQIGLLDHAAGDHPAVFGIGAL